MTDPSRPGSLLARALAPVDAASLVFFRVAFGLLLAAATARFVTRGWVHAHFVAPERFLPFWDQTWLAPLPGAGMYVVYAVMGLAALAVAAGVFTRLSAATFTLLFAYAHLVDVTHYLNHYVLVILLGALLTALPLGDFGSVDALLRARRGIAPRTAQVPAYQLWLVRAQVGLVYFYGGVAKLNPDWLLDAQPLATWLPRHADAPLVGPVLALPATALLMSWAGVAFDLSVPFLLSWRRTRPFAYAAAVGFHAITGLLFQIGWFPLFMIAFGTIFFPPSWPRDALARLGVGLAPPAASRSARPRRVSPGLALAAAYLAVQLLVPLRFLLYPGEHLWTEQGMRFAWKVMIVEKNGSLDLRVTDRATGRTSLVAPTDYFDAYQVRMLSTQPDLILASCHAVRRDFAARGVDVEVRADAFVAWHGRPAARLVDPTVDLGREPDSLAPKRWILPAPPRVTRRADRTLRRLAASVPGAPAKP